MASQSNPSQRDTAETESSDQAFNIAEQRIRVLGGSTETSAAFQIDHEGHTLGNALRYTIMKNPKVDFCGYTIPHPAEDRINLRIQTVEGGEGAPPSYIDSRNLKANKGPKIENYSAYDALEKGFNDLMDLCDVVTETFTVARDAHQDKD